MRFHVVALPHTQTTADYSACAYTNKVRGFCTMMKARGHTVFLYAGEENEAPCDALIPCIGETDRAAAVGTGHYTAAPFDACLPHWQTFNAAVIAGIKQRAHRQDFICLIAGHAQKPIADALPHMLTVEFGVGYSGVFSRFRVFESYAWMHMVYGAHARGGDPSNADGQWFDAVIPGYLDPDDFPFRAQKDDYFLFIGRLTDRKGYRIAIDVCKKMGKRLILAGPGTPPEGSEYVGVVGPEERGRLMAGAQAVFVPTHYVEPFGNVAIEAMACGTPVITTDWGAFTETVIDEVTGFRCRTFAEFCAAVERVKELDCRAARWHVLNNYSLKIVGAQYERHFERLNTLWRDGWYELSESQSV